MSSPAPLCRLKPLAFLCLLFIGTDAAAQSTPAKTSSQASVYTRTLPSADGIGKVYMGREIAQVMGHAGAKWLDRHSREAEEGIDKLMEILGHRLKPDAVLADIGAGSGYLTLQLAALVPRGKVIAEDIDPEMLALVTRKKQAARAANIETVLGTITDPKLPPESVDAVILVDTYHEWDHPHEMMAAVQGSLKPGGLVFQIEYRGEDPSIQILPHHTMTVAQARKEMEAAGLRWMETLNDLPQQHLIIYEKPKS